MFDPAIQKHCEEIRILIEERLKIKGRTLAQALKRAGRLLPKWAQRDGRYLVKAQELTAHPKLRLMIDDAKVVKAHQALVDHLKTIDPADRRKGKILSLAGSISFNLIVVVAAFITYLVWRGFV